MAVGGTVGVAVGGTVGVAAGVGFSVAVGDGWRVAAGVGPGADDAVDGAGGIVTGASGAAGAGCCCE